MDLPRTTNHGFTLVEVLVSLVIISITATGIFASFIAAQSYVHRSKRRVIAFNFARQQFERLKPSVIAGTNPGEWDNTTANCNPDLNGLVVTSALNCPGSNATWTSWSNFAGDFGTTWNGQRRYKVEAVGSGDYREVQTQIRWNEPQ